jgi:iron complex outermembrane receptor protein
MMTKSAKAFGRASMIALQALLGASVLSVPALAQETVADSSESEDLVVTARRRAENLQDTPVAITVLSATALEERGLTSTTDLDQVAPNLQFTSYGTLTGNNSAAQVFIRGIGQTDATPAVDPGVGLYIDEVYMGRSVGGAMDFRDIASVQVLRGPQGTLFGRNTIGGAVLLTTNAPGEGAGNTLRVGVGEDNLFEGFAAFDIPISETWAARASVGLRQRDGYVTRAFDGVDLGNEDAYSGQASIRWTPSTNVTFTARADYASEDENGSPFVFQSMNPAALFVGAASIAAGCPNILDPLPPPTLVGPLDDDRCGNNSQALGSFTNGGTFPASSSLENYGASLVAEWEVNDALTLKSITSSRHLEWAGSRDADNTPLLILHTNYASESEQFSQEFQASVDLDRVQGVIGAYYFDESTFDRVLVYLGNPGTSYDTQRVNLDTEAWALFTEWSFDITDALSVSAGIRYTDEEKSLQGIMFNVAGAATPEPAPPAGLCPFGGAPPTQTGCLFLTTNPFVQSFSSTTGSASIQYRWSPEFMTYASWSQGFKSGGFNQRYNNAPPGNAPIGFDAETADTFELGFKSNPAPGLRVNAAIFTTEYDQIQMTYRLGVVPLLFNAGVATINGAELEVAWRPSENLSVDLSVGYLDDGFDTITNPPPFGIVVPTSVATTSSTLPFTPELQASLGVGYDFHLGNSMTLTPRLNVSYTEQQYFDAGNSSEIAQLDAVTIVNGSLVLAGDAQRWSLTLRGDNLTDELYPVAGTSSLTTASGYAEIIYARPRSFSLLYSMDF